MPFTTQSTTKRSVLGTLLAISMVSMVACSNNDTETAEPTIEPATQAPSDTAASDTLAETDNSPSSGASIEYFYADDVETQGTFVFDEAGIETTIVMEAVGGIVTHQSTTNVFDYATFGITSPEEAKEALNEVIIVVDDIEGFEQEIEYGQTQATQVTRVDFEIMDLSEAENLPGAMTSGVSEDAQVSYENNRQMLLEVGFVEIE